MPLFVDSNGHDYDYRHKDRAEQLCENASKFTTFKQLENWYFDFGQIIGEYVQTEEEQRHRGGSNVNSHMSLHIKDALTDSYIIQSDWSGFSVCLSLEIPLSISVSYRRRIDDTYH